MGPFTKGTARALHRREFDPSTDSEKHSINTLYVEGTK